MGMTEQQRTLLQNPNTRVWLAAKVIALDSEAREHDRQAAIKRSEADVYRAVHDAFFLEEPRATPAFGSTRAPLPADEAQ